MLQHVAATSPDTFGKSMFSIVLSAGETPTRRTSLDRRRRCEGGPRPETSHPAETRSVPISPALVALLRHHLREYGAVPDGWLFRAARGVAFTPAQQTSPLARRPYDLRYAAVFVGWHSGVPSTEVHCRTGHSVAILLKV